MSLNAKKYLEAAATGIAVLGILAIMLMSPTQAASQREKARERE